MKEENYKKTVNMTENDHQTLLVLAKQMGIDANAVIVYLIRNFAKARGLEAFGNSIARIDDRLVHLSQTLDFMIQIQKATWIWMLILDTESFDRLKADPSEFEHRRAEANVTIKGYIEAMARHNTKNPDQRT